MAKRDSRVLVRKTMIGQLVQRAMSLPQFVWMNETISSAEYSGTIIFSLVRVGDRFGIFVSIVVAYVIRDEADTAGAHVS